MLRSIITGILQVFIPCGIHFQKRRGVLILQRFPGVSEHKCQLNGVK